MNKSRRKSLNEAKELIYKTMEIIDVVKEEEQEAFDNMPESFQEGDRGEEMQECIEQLEETYSSLDETVSTLEEL